MAEERQRRFTCAPGYICIAPEEDVKDGAIIKGSVYAASLMHYTDNGTIIHCPIKVGKSGYFLVSTRNTFMRNGKTYCMVEYDAVRASLS